jgi:hypothetical protein
MPERVRQPRRQHHADRHRLAVVEAFGIALFGLDRMAEGVAEVEQGALAMFQRVAGDDLGLVLAAARDGLGSRASSSRPAGRSRSIQPRGRTAHR